MVFIRLIFNTADTSELRTAKLSPKGVRNSEILLYWETWSYTFKARYG